MNFSKLFLSNDQREVVEILMKKSMLHNIAHCKGSTKKPHVECEMKLIERHDTGEFNWRCSKYSIRRSIRVGSFFEGTRIHVVKMVKLFAGWAQQTSFDDMALQLDIGRHTISNFYSRLRGSG